MSAMKKVLRGVFKGHHNDDDDYMLENPIWRPELALAGNSTDDDASSIRSYSTTSTVDDNPGTGRLIDKHLYQKGGRRVEKLIFWAQIRLPNVNPVLISRILTGITISISFKNPTIPLSALKNYYTTGPIVISGLQNLVQQTQ